MQAADLPARARANRCEATKLDSYAALSKLNNIPAATLWRRTQGKPSRKDKAASQQYLTPQEEKALVHYLLRAYENGRPFPTRALRSFAQVIARQRPSTFQVPATDHEVPPPGKNWPQGFYKRHPELKSKRMRALDLRRHDHNIYDKVVQWFTVIGRELRSPAIHADNVYNMDETGVLLSVLNSMKMLVSRDDLSNGRRAGVQRTLITAIECISASGTSLPPLIIWPASTHRSTWTTYPTPDWHFAVSKTGYTDTEISLYWIKHLFDPLTRARAEGKPRVLINDGLATHESLELMTYCFEKNIILCRLPSHTSHKLQPLDVGVFGPLKTAYRDQVERLYRGGANTVGKQHFTLLYSQARGVAFTLRNIKAAWAKTGLHPLDPDRVLRETQKPPPKENLGQSRQVLSDLHSPNNLLPTPVNAEGFQALRRKLEQESQHLDAAGKHRLQKLANAAEKAIADRVLLVEENRILFDQNNEKMSRSSIKSTVVGTARVMSYNDILEAQMKRECKKSSAPRPSRRNPKRPVSGTMSDETKRSRLTEVEKGNYEIEDWGLRDYCSVLQF
jgi:hypothetical protein